MSVEEYARTEDRVWIAKGTSVIDEGLGAETRATLQRLSEPEMVKQNRARFNSFGRQINLQNTVSHVASFSNPARGTIDIAYDLESDEG